MNLPSWWPTTRAIDAITHTLARIEQKVDLIMVTEAEFQTDMDAIKALVQKQSDAIAALTAEVTAVTNAPPTAVSQAQLDALDAEAKAILATTPTAPTTP